MSLFSTERSSGALPHSPALCRGSTVATNSEVIIRSTTAVLHGPSASLMDAVGETLKTLNPQPQSCPSFTSWTLLFEVGASPVKV